MIRLIAFLGNKGDMYSKTRHNAGWMFLDSFSALTIQLPWQNKFHGSWTKGILADVTVYVLKPMTFMNESGKSFGAMIRYFSFQPHEILVVHDDIELPFGTARLQFGGGLAGHKGLRSIAETIDSKKIHRLRIGIGRPSRGDVSNFVLGRFSTNEEAELPLIFSGASHLVLKWIQQGCNEKHLPLSYSLGT